MKKNVPICLCFLLLFTLPGFAQETPSPGEKIARTLYVKAGDAGGSGAETGIIAGYLTVYLAEHTDIVIVETEEEADCRIDLGLAQSETGAYILSFEGQDLFFKKPAFSAQFELEIASIIYIYQDIFPEILEKTIAAFPRRDVEIVEVIKETTVEEIQVKKVKAGAVYVTVTGKPGTAVTADTGTRQVIDATGAAEFEFPYDITVRFTAALKDHYTEKFKMVIGQENIAKELKQLMLPRWGITAGIDAVDVAVVPGFSFFFVPGRGYAGVSIDNNISSLVYAAEGFNTYSVQLTPLIYAGWYFLPPESVLRLAAELGFYTQIVFPYDTSPYISRIMRFGFQPSLIVDVSPFKRVRFFFQYAPRFFFDSPDTRAEYMTEYSDMLIPMGGDFYAQLWGSLFFGVRVQL